MHIIELREKLFMRQNGICDPLVDTKESYLIQPTRKRRSGTGRHEDLFNAWACTATMYDAIAILMIYLKRSNGSEMTPCQML